MRVRVGTHGYAGAFGLPGEGGSLRVKLKESCRCPGQAAVIPGLEFGVWNYSRSSGCVSPQSSELSPLFLQSAVSRSGFNLCLWSVVCGLWSGGQAVSLPESHEISQECYS